MAGPTAAIILPGFLTNGDRDFVEQLIRRIAKLTSDCLQIESTDIWISNGRPIEVEYYGVGRPFILTLGDSFHADEIDDIAKACPWPPKDRISVAAMCNGDVDHALLGHLCLHISENLHGIVDLEGDLRDLTSDESMLTDEGVRGSDYTSSLGNACVSHFLSPRAFRRWCEHADFGMVK